MSIEPEVPFRGDISASVLSLLRAKGEVVLRSFPLTHRTHVKVADRQVTTHKVHPKSERNLWCMDAG